MFFVLLTSALVVVVAVLGLRICRVAALSDRNSALSLAEWRSTSRLAERRMEPTDHARGRRDFDSPDEAFRAGGWQ